MATSADRWFWLVTRCLYSIAFHNLYQKFRAYIKYIHFVIYGLEFSFMD